MIRKWKRQQELNDYVVEELKELRYQIQQTNSLLAAVRDTTDAELKSLSRAFHDRTDHLA